MARLTRALLIPALLLFATVSADAGLIYFGTNTGEIYTVDTGTGIVNDIGSTGVAFTDIAFDPSGNLFGITFSQLYSIDLGSLTATAAPGGLGVGSANGLAFDSAGTLYMSSFGGGASLYTVNTGTGVAASVGGIIQPSAGDLEFDGAGNLYMTSTANNLIGFGGGPTTPGSVIGGLGYSNVYGLAYTGGAMWGLAGQSLFTVDLATGQGSGEVHFLGADFQDGEVVWGASAAVPEPGTLLLLGSGFLALGLWRRRSEG